MGVDDDRAVQALRDLLYDPVDWRNGVGVAESVALVLRSVRDDIALAYVNNQLRTAGDVEDYLNARIKQLIGRASITGDTTE